jgi:hypothetical protein
MLLNSNQLIPLNTGLIMVAFILGVYPCSRKKGVYPVEECGVALWAIMSVLSHWAQEL